MNQVIDRLQWQIPLFSPLIPKRSVLSALTPTWDCESKQIRIHRNQSFEYIATIVQPYLAYSSWDSIFIYSDYDDSLNWLSLDKSQTTDIEIIWLDFDRYSNLFNDLRLIQWLRERIKALRQLTNSSILVSNWISPERCTNDFNQQLSQMVSDLPGVWIYDRSLIYQDLHNKYFDLRASKLTGTNLSDRASILHGRELACRWIPTLLKPRLKGIVVDLDGTLYQGILGEDGVNGVILTPQHQALQSELLRLQQTGIFLTIASRNEWTDVEELFNTRSDFPLKLEHFSDLAVNWDEKSTNICNIAKNLRIATDTLLFIDDNPGELLSVAQHISDLKLICAYSAQDTLQAITWHPSLWHTGIGVTDELRLDDLKMSQTRQQTLSESRDIHEYLRSLQIQLTFEIDPIFQLQRLVELSRKTNQFNLNLRRLSEVELELAIRSPDYCVVSVALQDCLSDSGVIALIIGHYQEGWIIEEVCISCRALGRQLEDLVVVRAIQIMQQRQASRLTIFNYCHAPRNKPALDWLEKYSYDTLANSPNLIALETKSFEFASTQYPVDILIK
jgi:FkbH-like protein